MSLDLPGLLVALSLTLMLYAIWGGTREPRILVASGRVAGTELAVEWIHHSGSRIGAYFAVFRTTVVFLDGRKIRLVRRGRFSWPTGTELSIYSFMGAQEFSAEPKEDLSRVADMSIVSKWLRARRGIPMRTGG
jgi:hypothetical protein